jgi:hypothetical protein
MLDFLSMEARKRAFLCVRHTSFVFLCLDHGKWSFRYHFYCELFLILSPNERHLSRHCCATYFLTSCFSTRADDQVDPVSCFPEHIRKQQYFSLLRGFCFASSTQTTPNGKFSSAQWEYHTFVVTIENGDRLYGHCLRFFDLQSHANATVSTQTRSSSFALFTCLFCTSSHHKSPFISC